MSLGDRMDSDHLNAIFMTPEEVREYLALKKIRDSTDDDDMDADEFIKELNSPSRSEI